MTRVRREAPITSDRGGQLKRPPTLSTHLRTHHHAQSSPGVFPTGRPDDRRKPERRSGEVTVQLRDPPTEAHRATRVDPPRRNARTDADVIRATPSDAPRRNAHADSAANLYRRAPFRSNPVTDVFANLNVQVNMDADATDWVPVNRATTSNMTLTAADNVNTATARASTDRQFNDRRRFQ